jgi:beta-glucanase (GH16 family)
VNYHSPSGAHNQGTVPGIWTNDYHIYGIYRQRFKSDVYYDGKLVKSYTTDDSGNPQYPVINVGQSNSRTKVYGQASQVKVDYVRVWRK